jgi:hypothetical protein
VGDAEFMEKARSISTPRKWGSKKTTRVRRDDDGTHAGLQIEHWDDRMDAVVRPKPVELSMTVDGK